MEWIMENFVDGNRIRLMREALDLTQEQLAELIGVPILQINRYENNKTQPNADMIARVARGLNCSADYLLGLTNDPGKASDSALSAKERLAISAWRIGDVRKAIKLIIEVEEENKNEINDG